MQPPPASPSHSDGSTPPLPAQGNIMQYYTRQPGGTRRTFLRIVPSQAQAAFVVSVFFATGVLVFSLVRLSQGVECSEQATLYALLGTLLGLFAGKTSSKFRVTNNTTSEPADGGAVGTA